MPRRTNFTNQNGNTYFRVTAVVGKNPDNTPIRKQFYGESKKQAEAKRDEYLSGIKKGLAVNYDKATFGAAFKSWFEDVLRPNISVSSYSRFEIDYRLRISNCNLCSLPLIDIRSANIQSFYNSLTCTPKTVHSVHKLISMFFRHCLEADLIIKNPLLAVKLPDIEEIKKTNTALSDNDINKLLQEARKNPKNFIFVFAIFSGLREGEILALTHKDIDLSNDIINVNKSVKHLTVNGAYAPILTTPKTKSSIRTVPILGAIKKLLKAHISKEIEKHFKLGIPLTKDSVLFSSDACTYREAPNLLRSLKRLCKRIGIEETTFHSLRHSFCTILAKQGVPLKTASILMGHSDISVTAKIYTHVDDAEKKKGIEKLAVYF